MKVMRPHRELGDQAWSAAPNAPVRPPHPIDPDPAALRQLGLGRCLDLGIVPLAPRGALRPVLLSADRDTAALRDAICGALGRVAFVPADPDLCRGLVLAQQRHALAHGAEHRVDARDSCRAGPLAGTGRFLLPLALALLFAAVAQPGVTLALVLWAALAVTAANTTLGALGLVLSFRDDRAPDTTDVLVARAPQISLMVPLFRETSVLTPLIARLGRLDYPADLLDILLICEEGDLPMRRALNEHALPATMRVVVVPRGGVQTKPRAMNYALTFARGDIVGVYDAEDAPGPDQLRQVVRRFAAEGPRTACLQGALTFYNTADTWITRAFALDYAMWFRLVLPALSRMDAVVPLGGTTVFFRRAALEDVGAWDAHNVTEDADLGVRLRRRGYRCALFGGVTREEATARPWPWIRQRSRWLKGYALTWAVHMRSPRRLMADLGLAGFLWFQLLFLGALGGFALAPALWLCWLAGPGATIPAAGWAPQGPWLAAPLAVSALVQLACAVRAARLAGIGRAAAWAPVLWPYFALGTVALYKALAECVTCPFYWDKTAHGVSPRGAPG